MIKLTEIIKDLQAGVNIKRIDLYRCGIGNEAVKLLVQTLEKNNTVTEIDLSTNQISKDGAKWIAHLLENNSSVTCIELGYNKIDNDSARLILQAVRKNKIVTEMSLYGNKSLYSKEIDYNLQENINKILERNIQYKEAQAIEELSKKNDQGIDLVQEKLPDTNLGSEEKQDISKEMQQLKEVAQEQKSEQQEEANAALAQIINKQTMQDDMLKAMAEKLQIVIQKLEERDQQLDVAVGEIKLLIKEQSSIQVGQAQQTENNSGTEIEHSELLLGVVNLEQTDQY